MKFLVRARGSWFTNLDSSTMMQWGGKWVSKECTEQCFVGLGSFGGSWIINTSHFGLVLQKEHWSFMALSGLRRAQLLCRLGQAVAVGYVSSCWSTPPPPPYPLHPNPPSPAQPSPCQARAGSLLLSPMPTGTQGSGIWFASSNWMLLLD